MRVCIHLYDASRPRMKVLFGVAMSLTGFLEQVRHGDALFCAICSSSFWTAASAKTGVQSAALGETVQAGPSWHNCPQIHTAADGSAERGGLS